ncbi:MAG TPA: ClpX C4-type zinc finger protein [Candidatus Angelobacter sp.]|nr:ClpX C4-type zinc finger protein [Candidatus Angelobacter sp.]
MQDTPRCSFCGKPQGRISSLVSTRKGSSPASICEECIEACRKILVKSGTEPVTDPPQRSAKSYYKVSSQPREPKQLSCSFCGISQHKAHRLIASALGLPPTYICDKCVARGEAATGSGHRASLGSWIARKLGRYDTGIHHIG